jgi:hypothetical protein
MMGTNRQESDFLRRNLDLIRERLNRRQGERLRAEVEFDYKVSGKEGIYNGLSYNISSFGMAFLADTVLYEGESLLFYFRLNRENLVIPGRVKRVKGKEISVEFNLDEEERHRFIRLFNQEITSKSSNIRISMNSIQKRLE